MSCRRLNVLKMRSPHGSVAWDGMEWKLFSEVHPLCCGAILSKACVWGAWCCWPMLAAAGPSFLSESQGWLVQFTNTWFSPKQDFFYTPFLPRNKMDLCSLSLSFTCGWGEQAAPVEPQCFTTTTETLYTVSHAVVEPTPMICTGVVNNWNILTWATFRFVCF